MVKVIILFKFVQGRVSPEATGEQDYLMKAAKVKHRGPESL